MEYFYFHNFIYEKVWQDNRRRTTDSTPLMDVLHKYSSDYKVIFIGDASMAPYEIISQFGSVEHMNDESGRVWMQRLMETYNKVVWLNPTPEHLWGYTQTIGMTRELVENHMYPLTLEGLDKGIRYLTK
jgi:uncharacterized protein with von Willebrand factor type A (vWA) domain